MEQRVLSVRHGDEPLDDRTTAWIKRAGYDVDTRLRFRGETLEVPGDDLATTIVYGGPYNVYETDRYPFLLNAYRWIDACPKAGIRVLGICQCAQMIADHFGAWTGARKQGIFEFRYDKIVPIGEASDFLTASPTVCLAHFQTFDLAHGAVRLAANDNYENQAVRFGKPVYGMQFHPELTEQGFRRWHVQKAYVYGSPGALSRAEQDHLLAAHDAAQGFLFEGVLEIFIGRAA
jgi:GMP synthase (glutamine-hydrolysing)